MPMKLPILLAVLLALLLAPIAASAQAVPNRSAELEKAYQEARAASVALEEAEKRREQGVESQPGERIAGAGGSRPTENYWARQGILEQEVALARKRYDAAIRRWNDLK